MGDVVSGEPENKFSEPFREMAERIDRNLQKEFGGAVLIVPPTGDPVAVMITDPKTDAGAFWGIVTAKVQAVVMEYQAESSQNRFPTQRR